MKPRVVASVVALALVGLPAGSPAQVATGEVFGKVTDPTGAVLPGVTVTLTGPVLLQPQVTLTTEAGNYRFPEVAIGVYSMSFNLADFQTVVRTDISVEIGFSVWVDAMLEISALEETITVTGDRPIIDVRDTSRRGVSTIVAPRVIRLGVRASW